MSSSNEAKKTGGVWGTVFSPHGEHTLGGLENPKARQWTEKDEADYLERVREKAVQLGTGLIAEARAEAESIRESAKREGYNAGLAEAQSELDSFRAGMTESVSAVLTAIEGQCSHIFEQWRDELAAVARLAVQRVTGLEIEERRSAMLETLLVEAVGVLEKRRELVIRVNPEDGPVLDDIIGMTKERFPDVQSWRVKADPAIAAGGMVVESESSLAEGRVESRLAAVDAVMKRLTLPEHPETEPAP